MPRSRRRPSWRWRWQRARRGVTEASRSNASKNIPHRQAPSATRRVQLRGGRQQSRWAPIVALGRCRVLVAVAGAVPLAVVQVVLEAHRCEGESRVVYDDVHRIAPPGVAPHADGIQNLFEVEPDLEANLALAKVDHA